MHQVHDSEQNSSHKLRLSPASIALQVQNCGLKHHSFIVCWVSELVPPDIQQEVRQLYNASCELLRHFWSCFPVTNKELEEKVKGSVSRPCVGLCARIMKIDRMLYLVLCMQTILLYLCFGNILMHCWWIVRKEKICLCLHAHTEMYICTHGDIWTRNKGS